MNLNALDRWAADSLNRYYVAQCRVFGELSGDIHGDKVKLRRQIERYADEYARITGRIIRPLEAIEQDRAWDAEEGFDEVGL